jgi:hypothetical protein
MGIAGKVQDIQDCWDRKGSRQEKLETVARLDSDVFWLKKRIISK